MIIPISIFTTMMMPRWIGSMPSLDRNWEDQWRNDDQKTRGLHKLAPDQKDNIDHDQEGDWPKPRLPAWHLVIC